MQRTIIYPGTFDPITKGHVDLVKRSLQLFDKVIVGVASDTKKETAFTAQERVALAEKALAKFNNVEICTFSGLLVHFAQRKKVRAILRGLRAVSDFEYEFQLATANRQLNAEIETIFLTPAEQYTFISSSMVREIAMLGGDVSSFVPKNVAKALVKLYR